MWKYITRGLRAPFEKGSWTNFTSATATDQGRGNVLNENKPQVPCPFKFVPSFLEKCQHRFSKCRVQSGHHERDNKNKGDKSSDKSGTEDTFHSENFYFQPCAVLEAVGWSGVLVLGWSILQPWYRHLKTSKPLVESEINPDAVKRYSSLYKLLLNPVFSQPINNHVLPTQIPVNNKQVESFSTSPSTSISSTASSFDSDSKSIEEAFDDAANEVRKVHERAIGEAENRRGVSCLSHKKHHEAIEHFKAASALKHAPAAFNLGQCYELGIGTKQDFTEAAHWYKTASDMGHPSATYNLGVFYAHGWGGLKSDSKKARSLFLIAAKLGQPEAQAALNLKKSESNQKVEEKYASKAFESRSPFDFSKISDISWRFITSVPDQSKEFNIASEYRKPVSSLPSSSNSSVSSSPPSSSSLSPNNDFHFMYDQKISTIDESSENCSDPSADYEWQQVVDLANMNGNSATLYRLAVCYENSPTVDPELILQLYRMAADHGHQRAKQYLVFLEEHYALGTLVDYLNHNKKRSKHSSIAECATK